MALEVGGSNPLFHPKTAFGIVPCAVLGFGLMVIEGRFLPVLLGEDGNFCG